MSQQNLQNGVNGINGVNGVTNGVNGVNGMQNILQEQDLNGRDPRTLPYTIPSAWGGFNGLVGRGRSRIETTFRAGVSEVKWFRTTDPIDYEVTQYRWRLQVNEHNNPVKISMGFCTSDASTESFPGLVEGFTPVARPCFAIGIELPSGNITDYYTRYYTAEYRAGQVIGCKLFYLRHHAHVQFSINGADTGPQIPLGLRGFIKPLYPYVAFTIAPDDVVQTDVPTGVTTNLWSLVR